MKKKLLLSISILSSLMLGFTSCTADVSSSTISSKESTEVATSSEKESSKEEQSSSSTSQSIKDKYNAISVTDAVNLTKGQNDDFVSDEVFIYGLIKTISNTTYGEMTITDGTSDLYVYGLNDFSTLSDKPNKGDEVVIKGNVKIYNSKAELGKSTLVEFNHIKQDVSDYTSMNVLEVRNASQDTKVKIKGIVSSITYADKMVPNGFYLVDNTSSIYVYDKDVAANVSVGNEVEVAGTKTYYIASSEASNAAKYNYKGSNQIQECTLISNDKLTHDFDTSWISEMSVKEIMDSNPSDDITNKIFKVNALIKKVEGSGFVNYYIDDFDGTTGSYVYTMNSGSDYSYLDEYDGKKCTLYLTPINAKSSATGCVYRFEVIKVLDSNYQFDTSKIATFALDYYCLDQFETSYTSDPSIECVKEISNTIIPFDNVTVTYSSSNEDAVYFENSEDNKIILHTKNAGTSTITITTHYGELVASKTCSIEVKEKINYQTKSVKEVIDTEDNTEVYVKGIVGPSLVNKVGFYIIDETGSIAVMMDSSEEMAKVHLGDEVILKGERQTYIKNGVTGIAGQSEIYGATLIENLYGDHAYSTASFIKDKTLADLTKYEITDDHTTEVYTLTATISYEETNYYSRYALTSGDARIQLYSANAGQYSFLSNYKNQEVEMEIALCNFNSKSYYTAVCLSITVDGNKICNQLNFSK